MSQDQEFEVQQMFLEEAQDYIDALEDGLLGLDNRADDFKQRLDAILRAAHSLKGGAAMMQFDVLSQTTHRLEDVFKLLKSSKPSINLQRSLLSGVGLLRQITDLSRQGKIVDQNWSEGNAVPIFSQIEQLLETIEVSEAEEEEEEETDLVVLMFETEVESYLTELEAKLTETTPIQADDLLAVASDLSDIGLMLDLDNFVLLNQSISAQIEAEPDRSAEIARLALTIWRRSQAMVLTGNQTSIESEFRLPSSAPLQDSSIIELEIQTDDRLDDLVDDRLDDLVDDFGDDVENVVVRELDLFANFPSEVSETRSIEYIEEANLADFVIPETLTELVPEVITFDASEIDTAILDLSNLTEDLESPFSWDVLEEELLPSPFSLEGICDDLDLFAPEPDPEISQGIDLFDAAIFTETIIEEVTQEIPKIIPEIIPEIPSQATSLIPIENQKEKNRKRQDFSSYISPESNLERNISEYQDIQKDVVESVDQLFEDLESGEANDLPESLPDSVSNLVSAYIKNSSIRLPVTQLDHLHDLSEELAIERSSSDAQLRRLRSLVQTLSVRIRELEKSNIELSNVYDRTTNEETINHNQLSTNTKKIHDLVHPQTFDSLEMDRYTDLHSLFQSVMETIVKLEEVSEDIDLTIAEAEQSAVSFTRNFRQLHNTVLQMRMRPLSDVVGRFPRVIRGLALEHGKQVDVDIQNGEILIDRVVLDVLTDPLNHMLRNAFDHGIEDVATRIKLGKPTQGTISITASQDGDQTMIKIGDDGKGIDVEKIRSKVRQNLIKEGKDQAQIDRLNESELLSFIFEPGFSTTDRVTALSGRGVGMDVVRTELAKIGAEIRINTGLGVGTTFTISIPLTLASTRIMLVETEHMLMAIPAGIVQAVIPYQPEQITDFTFLWRGQQLPVLQIHDHLRLNCIYHASYAEDKPGTARAMLVIEYNAQILAVPVDACWGEQEVNIRQAEGDIPLPDCFSGCIILGSRQVVPLLNSTKVFHWINQSNYIPPQAQPIPIYPSSPITQPDCILVVDDSVNVRRYLAIALEKAGFMTEQAIDGEDAIEKLLGGLQVSAVISDMEMPRTDGYALIARMRSDVNLSNLPIIMLTSRSSEKHRQLAINLGANAYLTKPYQEQELLQILKNLLDPNQDRSTET